MFEYFKKISSIPRPSGKEEAITDYLMDFAKERNLSVTRDPALNVIIKKPASPGREGEEPIILQAHTDMVCEKESNVSIDMEREGITYQEDGGWLVANGTTLGADDGIGMAMMLKVLSDDSISHPPLECIFTAAEEVGLIGANALDASTISGKRMINLDSEEEGFFITGCAGGGNVTSTLSFTPGLVTGKAYILFVDGLLGGHSGSDINLGRGNANVILARILNRITQSFDIMINEISGGQRDNAIPRNAYCILYVDYDKTPEITTVIKDEVTSIAGELGGNDPGLNVTFKEVYEAPGLAISPEDSKKLAAFIEEMPKGVIGMCRDIPDMVETSLNLGILKTEPGENGVNIKVNHHIRSSSEREFKALKDNLINIVEKFDGTFEISGEYPAWEHRADSHLTQMAVSVYENLFNKTPVTTVIHAGLECGIISKLIPGMDVISIGPDIKNAHSPSETLSVSSAERTYEFLVKLLEQI